MSMNEFRLVAMGAGCSALFAVLFYIVVSVLKKYTVIFRIVTKKDLENEDKLDSYDNFISGSALEDSEQRYSNLVTDYNAMKTDRNRYKNLHEGIEHNRDTSARIDIVKKEEKKPKQKRSDYNAKSLQETESRLRRAVEYFYKEKTVKMHDVASKFGFSSGMIYQMVKKTYNAKEKLSDYGKKYDMVKARELYDKLVSEGFTLDEVEEEMKRLIGSGITSRAMVKAFYRLQYII